VPRLPFSDRTHWDEEETPYSQLLAQKKGGDNPLIDLTASNPTKAGFNYPEDEIRRALSRVHPYMPDAQGSVQAREAIANYYAQHGRSVTPDQILITSCTSEAYSFLFKLLCDPGNGILLPSPSYPLFSFLVEGDGLDPIPYSLESNGEGSWAWRTKTVEKVFSKKAHALVIVSPNNPTGTTFNDATFQQICDWCAGHNLPIILDEVFLDYPGTVTPGNAMAIAEANDVLLFSLGGLSKCAGLPQLKLGWIVVSGPPPLRRQAMHRLTFLADAFLTIGTPVQNAASELLEIGRSIRTQIRTRISENERWLASWASAHKDFSLFPREGGWYVLCRLPAGEDDERFVYRMLAEKNVTMHPGFFYNIENIPVIVLSLIIETKDLEEGLRRISE
jgi:alanine-synthesizing transaminase